MLDEDIPVPSKQRTTVLRPCLGGIVASSTIVSMSDSLESRPGDVLLGKLAYGSGSLYFADEEIKSGLFSWESEGALRLREDILKESWGAGDITQSCLSILSIWEANKTVKADWSKLHMEIECQSSRSHRSQRGFLPEQVGQISRWGRKHAENTFDNEEACPGSWYTRSSLSPESAEWEITDLSS